MRLCSVVCNSVNKEKTDINSNYTFFVLLLDRDNGHSRLSVVGHEKIQIKLYTLLVLIN